MDLRQLRYFIAVAEERHMGRAASRLHLSQPPLTRQIRQLENELGARLFTRTPHGMELTQAGRIFLEEARNIRSIVALATERTQRAGQGKLGRLDIAIFGSAILDTMPKLVLAFRQAYPEVDVALHTMSKNEQIQALRQHRIDVGFNRMLTPHPDIVSKLVKTERLLLAVNDRHPLARHTAVPAKALAENPLILFPTGPHPSFIDKVMEICRALGFVPKISQEVSDVVTAIALVASGFGMCLIPTSATTLTLPHVVYKPIRGLPAHARSVDLTCIYRTSDRSPLLKSFLDTVDEFFSLSSKEKPQRASKSRSC